MADRYLLESGAPDGYLLEDGTGVLLLEDATALPGTGSNIVAAEPRRYTPPRQTGACDFYVNLAVLVVASTAIARAPVFVNAPTRKPAPQIEHAPNVAAGGTSAVVTRVVPPIDEPTSYNRPFTQVEISPNLAVNFTAPVVTRPLAPFVEPTIYRRKSAQFDTTTNLAVNSTAQAVTRPAPIFIEPTIAKRKPPLVIEYPNLAAQAGAESFSMLISSADDLPARKWPGVDLYPNLSAQVAVVVTAPKPFVDPIQYKRVGQPPELFPNLAVNTTVTFRIQPLNDLQPARRWSVQTDIYPNLAAQVTAVVTPLASPVDPQIARKTLVSVDLSPNLAVSALAPQQPLFEPIDPTVFKRYPPQVDVYQNQAINAAAQAPVVPPAPIEPTLFVRYPPQIVEFPNLVISEPYVSPVIPPVAPTEQNSGGWATRLLLEQHAVHRRNLLDDAKRRKQEAIEAAKDDAVQKEIARRIHAELQREEEKQEIDRLKKLVESSGELTRSTERVQNAFLKAKSERTFSRLQALQRELIRAQEEEEMALLMILLADD